MKNRVKASRLKLGLTQRDLAERAGTSQQQIQRIETGKVAARLDLAAKLAEALESPLTALFPGAAKSLRSLVRQREDQHHPTEETYVDLSKAGLEADIRAWFFRVLLRGQEEPLTFRISPAEQRRLFSVVQGEDEVGHGLPFVVFETLNEMVAINLRQLVYCHFLFEVAAFVGEEDEELPIAAQIFLAGDRKALTFDVDPDDGTPDDEDDEGEFRHIFASMELSVDETERFHFTDEDGEDVFLRAGDVALLKVPLSVVDPDYETGDDSF
jgi:transcriptional regulator with XRE-family HTH domain